MGHCEFIVNLLNFIFGWNIKSFSDRFLLKILKNLSNTVALMRLVARMFVYKSI